MYGLIVETDRTRTVGVCEETWYPGTDSKLETANRKNKRIPTTDDYVL